MAGPTTPEGRRRARANLAPPIRKGEVRNPEGRNGYTRQRELFQKDLARCLKAKDLKSNESLRRKIVSTILHEAARGRPWACQLVAKRLWPEPVEYDGIGSASGEPPLDLTLLSDEELEVIERISVRLRSSADS